MPGRRSATTSTRRGRTMRREAWFLPLAGCARRCVYCDQRTITGVSSAPAPEVIAARLRTLTEPVELCYFGGSFGRLPLDTMRAYAEAVLEAPRGSVLTFSSYPADWCGEKGHETLRALRGLPIGTIELGTPSLDPAVLAACRRDDDPDEVLASFEMLRDEGIHLGAQVMIGLPRQTADSSIEDLERIARLMPDGAAWHLRIYPCLVLRGTELERMLHAGEVRPLTADEAAHAAGRLIVRARELGMVPIRVGLHDTESLRQSVVAGPYHPALGELAYSCAAVLELAAASPRGPWTVSARDMSKFTGHSMYGVRYLAELSGMSSQEVCKKLRYL